MILRKTARVAITEAVRNMGKLSVFVLGAGASAPFNYPLGSKLVEEVLAFHPDESSGVHPNLLGPFQEALKKSGDYSVDALTHSNW
jgi:hypothetical protein